MISSKLDISIPTEEFLTEVRGIPPRTLAVELLRKLLSRDLHTPAQERGAG